MQAPSSISMSKILTFCGMSRSLDWMKISQQESSPDLWGDCSVSPRFFWCSGKVNSERINFGHSNQSYLLSLQNEEVKHTNFECNEKEGKIQNVDRIYIVQFSSLFLWFWVSEGIIGGWLETHLILFIPISFMVYITKWHEFNYFNIVITFYHLTFSVIAKISMIFCLKLVKVIFLS